MTKEALTKETEKDSTLNTGVLLTTYFKEKRIRKAALTRLLGRKPGGLILAQKNASMQTTLLWEISHVLKHNFFQDIASLLPDSYTTNAPADTIKDDRIAQLELENKLLTAEKEVLLKVITQR